MNYIYNSFSRSNEKPIEHFFSSIACNSTIASNKQRQEHINLATIQRAYHKGAHDRFKNLLFVKPRTQMQTLTRMDKVLVKDYYHMTTMDENMN